MKENAPETDLRSLLRLAAPIALTQLGAMAMGVVDTLMAGPLGEDALAGLALGNTIYFSVVVAGTGVMMSLDGHASQAWGGGRREDCGAFLAQGLWVAAILSPLLALLMAAVPWVLLRLGYTPHLTELGWRYLLPLLPGILPLLVFQAYRSALAAANITRPVLISVVVANVAHVGMNLWFLHGGLGVPPLGVEGLAWSTTFCRLILLAGAWFGWHVGLRGSGVGRVLRRFEPGRALAILRTGLPLGGLLAAEVSAFGAVTLLQGAVSGTALAAHQVVLNIASTAFMVPLGIGAAAAVRCGQAVGRGDHDGVRRAGLTAIRVGLAYAACTATTMFLLRTQLVGLYRPPPEVAELGVRLIILCALFQAADATQTITMGALRGLSDTRIPFLIVLLGHWLLGIPFGAWLAFRGGFGASGLWIGLTIGLTIVAAGAARRFFHLSSRLLPQGPTI